jgi:integrase/recombinase XerD
MRKIININDKSKSSFIKSSELVNKYDQYLSRAQGLAPRTRQFYCSNIRSFLLSFFPAKKFSLNTLTPKKIVNFILEYTCEGGAHRAQAMVYSLRSFFKFLFRTRCLKNNLADAVPTVPMWKKRSIPVFLSCNELQLLLKSCNRGCAKGLRDYAILMMLITLGVRPSEVCKLTLDDIDWHKGEIFVRSKGSETRLPLFQDLGDALTDYLQNGRPKCSSNSLFVRVSRSQKAPTVVIELSGIRHIVRAALKRAGLNPEKKGAYLLRHTFATQLLQQGASLQEIGLILRHKLIETTAIYASVDFKKLATIVQPWPYKGKWKV